MEFCGVAEHSSEQIIEDKRLENTNKHSISNLNFGSASNVRFKRPIQKNKTNKRWMRKAYSLRSLKNIFIHLLFPFDHCLIGLVPHLWPQ